MERVHNQYCRDDWNMYLGDGPRGMGANGDGCVCELDPGEPTPTEEDLYDTTLCLYGTAAAECSESAVWHIWYEDSNMMTQACDPHLGLAIAVHRAREFHEFGSACNLRDSWWIPEMGRCVTAELGLELGVLKYA